MNFCKQHSDIVVGNLSEQLAASKHLLEDLSEKTEIYRTQLKTLLIIVNNILTLENKIEQKIYIDI